MNTSSLENQDDYLRISGIRGSFATASSKSLIHRKSLIEPCRNNLSFVDVSIQESNLKLVEQLMSKLIPDSKQDDLIICKKMSRIISKGRENNYMTIGKEITGLISQKIDDDNQLILGIETVDLISKVLVHYFLKMDKEFKIYTFNDFLSQLNLSKDDATTSTLSNIPLDPRSVGSFCINGSTWFNGSNEGSGINYAKRSILSSDYIIHSATDKMQKEMRFILSELVEMCEIFQNVKKILLYIPRTVNDVILFEYSLIFINFLWLFQNILEIEIDLSGASQCSESKFPIPFSEDFKVIQRDKANYMLLVAIFYFTAFKTKHIVRSLKLNIPYCFTTELDFLFKSNKLFLEKGFHLVELFEYTQCNLINLSVQFNSIDSDTFRKVVSLIHQNPNLRSISLMLFPNVGNDDYLFYKQRELKKLCANQSIKIEDRVRFRTTCDNFAYDEKEQLLSKLLNPFEINLELLFYSLSVNNQNLMNLNLKFELPNIIDNSDKYVIALQKFLFKLLLYTESSMNSIQILEISAENFPFDMRKFPNLHKQLNGLSLENNKSLKSLTVDFKISRIPNIVKLIPPSIENLKLGEIDIETFEALAPNFAVFSEMSYLSLTIFNLKSDTVHDYEILSKFLKSKKSKGLCCIDLCIKFCLTSEMIIDLIGMISCDSVLQYNFQFHKKMIAYTCCKVVGLSELIEITEKSSRQCVYYELSYRTYSNILFLFGRKLGRASIMKNQMIIRTTGRYLRTVKRKNVRVSWN